MPAKDLMFLMQQKNKTKKKTKDKQINVLICNKNPNNNKKFNKAVPNKKQTTKKKSNRTIFLFRDFLRFLIYKRIKKEKHKKKK